MPKVSDILKEIKDTDIKFVDLRFTDPRGKLQHVTMDAFVMDSDAFAEGIMFDGSSIAGWKAINESDMTLMPDPDTAHTDPFFAQSTMGIFQIFWILFLAMAMREILVLLQRKQKHT